MSKVQRRTFLQGLAVAAGFGSVATAQAAATQRPLVWGPMDVDRHRALCEQGIHLHVYVDGKDVSGHCRFFDDTPGQQRAEFFKADANGRHYLNDDKDGPAMETLHVFEVREGAPFR